MRPMPANFASGTVWTGDNLDIMRGMNSECVDLIYLDPPFNSNRNYAAPIGSKAAGAAFKDAWTLDDVDVHEHGELADRNPAAYAVIEAARQAHGKGMQSYLIFMAVRLVEMQRILKPTGSIYLHCDPTASHYLKLLMDGIFGRTNFRNEIVWKRRHGFSSAVHKSNRFGVCTDIMLFYAAGEQTAFAPQYSKNSSEYQAYIEKSFRLKDASGRRYQATSLTNPAYRPNLIYEYKGYQPHRNGWMISREKMEQWDKEGRIHFPKDKSGRLRRKSFVDELKGMPIQNLWDDVQQIGSHSGERTGYPTQKPIALLQRIILASSDPGDMVLDPFCGCATAFVAADRLQREWAGVDLSPLAIKLVDERIAEDRGLWGGVTALTEAPKRTDLGDLPNYRTHRHRLYGEQEGVCVGCDTHFPFRVMDVDHMLPRSKGGTDHTDNLQLLCSGCNRSKGGKTMAEWRAAT